MIAIATNTNTTTTTAKASATINAPDNASTMKWLASNGGGYSSWATVDATGTSVAGGSPFIIADLGVALALGDSVLLSYIFYDALGVSNGIVYHVQATRSNIAAQKTIIFTAGAFVAMVQPLGQTPNGTPYVTGSGSTGGVDELSLTANVATAPTSTFVGYQLNFLLAD
ncbi:MAG TPA: hypothetical protein VGH04_14240, partial [Gemmatimonadaceae bacterium]